MEKIKISINDLEKLLVLNDSKFKLDSSFESSSLNNLPDGDKVLDLRYRNLNKIESEEFMISEAQRLYDSITEKGYENRIFVFGNNLEQEKNYTPSVSLIGDFDYSKLE